MCYCTRNMETLKKSPETREIGGSRVLLVRKYTTALSTGAITRIPKEPAERCLLERDIRFVDLPSSSSSSDLDSVEDLETIEQSRITEPSVNHSTLIRGGAIGLTIAAVGLWWYGKASD